MTDKQEELLKLAKKRQSQCPPGFKQIGDYHNGAYECDFVSPYTKTAGNVDADVFVMLQDWSSDDKLSKPLDQSAMQFGYTPRLATNVRLSELLSRYLDLQLSDVYATNLFPYVKLGDTGATIRQEVFLWAAKEFGVPQIRIVSPKLVVCLGLPTFTAIRRAITEDYPKRMADAIERPFRLGSALVWCQAHTGNRGQSNRGRDLVESDWAKMAEAYKSRL